MDFYFFQQINSLAEQGILSDKLGVFFAKYLLYFLIILVILLFWKKWSIVFQSFLAAVVARFGVVELIRFLWARPRPFIENEVNLLLDHVNTAAFPSGHAAFSFALSTVVFLYLCDKKVYPASKFWCGAGIAFFIASFLISISRVFVGVHWPSDILAGAVVGILSGWLIVKIFKKF